MMWYRDPNACPSRRGPVNAGGAFVTAAIVCASVSPLGPLDAVRAIVGESPPIAGGPAAAKSNVVSWSSGVDASRSALALLNARVGASIATPHDGQRDADAFTTAPHDGQDIAGG
jgi:hypothetical protein